MKKTFHYNVILRPEPEGGFTVIVPSLPGCVTYGKTLNDAKRMAKDAIGAYVESLRKHKESIPTDEESFFTSLEIQKVPLHA